MIRSKTLILVVGAFAAITVGLPVAFAAKAKKSAEPQYQLTDAGKQLETKYAAMHEALKAEITRALPVVSEQKKTALKKAKAAVAAAENQTSSAGEAAGEIGKLQGVISNWKSGVGWMGRAKKKIAQAQADLKAATTDAARQAAQKALTEAQTDLASCEQRIKETEAKIAQAKSGQGALASAKASADAALAKVRAEEQNAAKALLADIMPVLSGDKMDAKLVKCAVLSEATPAGLAAFAQQGQEQQALVDRLLADDKLMKDMLVAGGASGSSYGQAMQIYSAIQQASPKAKEGLFQRLALATALEFAVPVKQKNAVEQKNAPTTIDPVKRYQHYEKAYLAGELDPAFKGFNAWEYRMVVDCDAPDEILAWGREMLRNYRPDHITNPNYGWRYSAAVKTEVPYGSQCVKDDLPTLNEYQNIPKDGGVCGRRAFFGRFVLRSFGIPVWGVTQHAHAALSHWTPKGWVINLGAGFDHSWWDKDDAPRSGTEFLLESQAPENAAEYIKVLRAHWVSSILGEESRNERKKADGGLWSNVAHDMTVLLAAHSEALGPLGQELAEANEPEDKQEMQHSTVKASDQQALAGKEGSITIPAVAHGKTSGSGAPMPSYSGGMQLHIRGGFKADYAFDAPQPGKYALTARVVTLQTGQIFLMSVNSAGQSAEVPVPYTVGLWQSTKPVEVTLARGKNTLNFALKDGSRDVTLKDFTLTPVR